jgi:hypothetical protein
MRNGALAALILGVALALGVAAGGYLIGRGLYAARASERFVTVKGLAEREVPANLIEIQDRDPFSPEIKKVRVFTTVQYSLED